MTLARPNSIPHRHVFQGISSSLNTRTSNSVSPSGEASSSGRPLRFHACNPPVQFHHASSAVNFPGKCHHFCPAICHPAWKNLTMTSPGSQDESPNPGAALRAVTRRAKMRWRQRVPLRTNCHVAVINGTWQPPDINHPSQLNQNARNIRGSFAMMMTIQPIATDRPNVSIHPGSIRDR